MTIADKLRAPANQFLLDPETAEKHGWPLLRSAADEIERLERRNIELEAHNAAMREALEEAINAANILCSPHHNPDISRWRAALSPDAGAKVLRVVEAARDCVAHKDGKYSGPHNGLVLAARLAEALAALNGGKP